MPVRPASATLRTSPSVIAQTQRNLDARGRAQAERTGQRLRELGLNIDRVLSSQWCRCLDTAERLGLGPVEQAPPLNSFFDAHESKSRQTEATRELLRDLTLDSAAILVTHQVNISAFLGRSTRSGEVLAFEIFADGIVEVLGSLQIEA